jgi:methylglutaconyl-CoA hydratase
LIAMLKGAGPTAQLECKALVRGVAHRPIDEDVIDGTAEHIAAVRASPEGREGVAAFLGKRPAAWIRTASAPGEGRADTGRPGGTIGRGDGT